MPAPAPAAAAVATASPPPRPVARAPHPVGAFLGSSHRDLPADEDPWAPDPVLDGVLAAGLASAGPAAHDVEAEAAAEAATALQESGFGSALHTALGELRRITDDPAPVPVGAVASSEAQAPRMTGHFDPAAGSGPDRASTQPRSMVALGRGTPAEWLASLGDWWSARWKELLPGMVVVTLVVVAFAVVLASGGRRANTSHVDSRRPLASDPPTTIAGLFTTASVPPGEVPPPDAGTSASDKATPSTVAGPVTPKDSSAGGAGASSAPTKASNPTPAGAPSDSPPATQVAPPDTTPNTTPNTTPDTTPTTSPTTSPTTTPTVSTTVPSSSDPPPVVCARRSGLC